MIYERPPIELLNGLGEGKNSVFVKSRNPNMVSAKKRLQAPPPPQKTTLLKSFRQRCQKNGGLP
jgi:hypothetical protein